MKKNIALNTIGNLIYNVCQWLLTIIVVRLSSDYQNAGYLGLAMTTGSSFATIAQFGMRNFQISDVRNEFSGSEYVSSRVLTCIAAYICCLIGAIPGNNLYQILCIDTFMICRISESLVDVFHGMDQKYNRYDFIGVSMIIRGILSVGIFSVGLITTDSLLPTITIMSIADLLAVLIYDLRKTGSLEKIRLVKINRHIFILLKKCAPIVIFTFLLTLFNLIPKNVLQQVQGTNELGIYTSISSPTLVVQLFAQVALSPLIPVLSEYYLNNQKKEFSATLRKIYAALLIIAVFTIAAASLLGRWGLSLLYGKNILENYDIFMPLIFCTIGLAFVWILYAIVVALRQIKIMLIGMIVDFVIVVLISYPLIRVFGKNGASLVQIIGYGIYIPFLIIVTEMTYRKKLKYEVPCRTEQSH